MTEISRMGRKPGRKARSLMAIISILGRRARPGKSAATICRAHSASACGIKQANCERSDVSESGATGVYLFGSQRIWFRHPGKDNSGISGFFQFGANDSETLRMNQYFGSGLTAFGLVPGRSQDSAGAGMACSWLNGNIFHRSSELMFQVYYQAHLDRRHVLRTSDHYIPTPGANRPGRS